MTEMLLRYWWEVFRFHFGMYACFDKKVKFPWGQLAGCGVYLILVEHISMPYSLLAAAISNIILFFSIEGATKEKAYQIGILFILNAGIGEIIELPRKYMLLEKAPFVWVLAEKIVSIFVLFGIWIGRKYLTEDRRKKVIQIVGKLMPLLFGILIISLYLTVICLNYSYQLVEDEEFRKLIRLFQPTALSAIWILGMMMISIREMNRQLLKMQEQEQELMEAQKDYYELLLQKEEDTRKYRHDMINQLYSLNILAEKQEWDALSEYLKQMQQEIHKISENHYDTGNFLLDSLSGYLLDGIEETVQVSVTGKLDEHATLEERGVSIIYSNLLKNAVEEMERCSSGQEKEIQIRFQNGEQMTVIEIENTIANRQIDITKTKKGDGKNHGFGLENVQKEVKRMHGMFETQIRETTFYTKVILPNRRSK